jgi:hypothetical protein
MASPAPAAARHLSRFIALSEEGKAYLEGSLSRPLRLPARRKLIEE